MPLLIALVGLAAGLQGSPASIDSAALIAIAKQAIRNEVLHIGTAGATGTLPPKGVFVTIERGGKVIGCRGALTARTQSLEQEVALAARSAAQHDPRYRPLTREDVKNFAVTVTIVDGLEQISNVDGLKPEDGLVVSSGDSKGVVLPWEGKDPHVRLDWAYKKAHAPEGSPAILYRLIARRFRE